MQHELYKNSQQDIARIAGQERALQEVAMDCTRVDVSLCAVSHTGLWFLGDHVLLGSLRFVPDRAILHSFRLAWSWLGHFLSTASHAWVIVGIVLPEFVGNISVRGSASASLHHVIHSLETFDADDNNKLVLHAVVCVPDTRVLAIFIHLLCVANRTGCAQALPTHEEIWLQHQGFQQQCQK